MLACAFFLNYTQIIWSHLLIITANLGFCLMGYFCLPCIHKCLMSSCCKVQLITLFPYILYFFVTHCQTCESAIGQHASACVTFIKQLLLALLEILIASAIVTHMVQLSVLMASAIVTHLPQLIVLMTRAIVYIYGPTNCPHGHCHCLHIWIN